MKKAPADISLGEIENDSVRVEGRFCSQYNLNTLTVNCDTFSTREQILDCHPGAPRHFV